jgi:hypothetical protein
VPVVHHHDIGFELCPDCKGELQAASFSHDGLVDGDPVTCQSCFLTGYIKINSATLIQWGNMQKTITLTDSDGNSCTFKASLLNGKCLTSEPENKDKNIDMGVTETADFGGKFTVNGDAWRDIESSSLEDFLLRCVFGDECPQEHLESLSIELETSPPGEVLS